MESKCDHFCEIVTENRKAFTGLDSNQFAFRFRAEQKRALQRDQLVSALSVSDTVDFDQIAADLAVSFGRKSPVSVLMQHAQYTRSKVNFVEVGEPDGPQHKPMFVALSIVVYSVPAAGRVTAYDCRQASCAVRRPAAYLTRPKPNTTFENSRCVIVSGIATMGLRVKCV